MTHNHPFDIPDAALDHIVSVFEDNLARDFCPDKGERGLLFACKYIAHYLGLELRLPSRSEEKSSFIHVIENIAKASQIRVRRVFLSGAWWRHDNGPLVAVNKKTKTPCALIPLKSGGYKLVESDDPQPRVLTDEEASTIGELAYTFYRPFPDKSLTWKDVFSFALAHQWTDFKRLLALQAFVSVIGLAIPIVTGMIIDIVIPTADFTLLGHFITGLVVITFATTTFNITQVISAARLKCKTNIAVQSAVGDRLLRLPLDFFRGYTAGDLATRTQGIDAIQQEITGAVMMTIMGGLFSLLTLGLIFFYDSTIALVALGLASISVLISLFGNYIQLKYQRELLYERGKNTGLLLQLLTGISKLRINNCESRAFLLWSEKFAYITKLFKKAQTIIIRLMLFRGLYGTLTTILFLAVVMARMDNLSFGGFIAINAAFGQFFGAFSSLFATLAEMIKIIPMYERVKPILTSLPEEGKTGVEPGELEGEVAINHVSFYYHPESPYVFTNLSITAAPGEFVALVGPSGAGKSTIFRLLLGFETPKEGKILYDGKNLATLNIRAVRRQLGVVLQTSSLVPGSIAENINGSSATLTMDDAWEAARRVGLDQDIAALPMQMSTLVTEGGRTFSMGQRQRLMIARALVHKPRVLLLDEATSALDNVTQEIVSDSLKQLNITRIVAAHRLSTIINADRIYVLDNKGRIVQNGTFAALMAEQGPFAELAKRQLA